MAADLDTLAADMPSGKVVDAAVQQVSEIRSIIDGMPDQVEMTDAIDLAVTAGVEQVTGGDFML